MADGDTPFDAPRHTEETDPLVQGWLEVLGTMSHYELLGVLEIAGDDAIQDAFHRFAESFHPDRHRTANRATRDGVTSIFRRGAEAYRVLRDPRRRAEYDLALAKVKELPETESGAPPSPRVLSLDDLCRTPGGRLHARQAERAITDGDLEEAAALLERALLADGSNPALERRLADLRALAALGTE